MTDMIAQHYYVASFNLKGTAPCRLDHGRIWDVELATRSFSVANFQLCLYTKLPRWLPLLELPSSKSDL